MATQLTAPAINAAAKRVAAEGKRLDLSDATLPGLRLRLTATGGKSWVLACRDTLGRMRRFPLGEYPTIGISEARDAARAMRVDVRKGADPVAEARRKRIVGKEAKDGIGTLTALLDLYAGKRGASLKSWPESRRCIDQVFARHVKKPLAMLTTADLQMTADAHKAQHSASAAVNYLRPVLKWAAKHGGYVAADLAALHAPTTIRQRKRVLSRDELVKLLPVLRASVRPEAAAIRFMLLTLARREEVAKATWGSIDQTAGTWTITETKNKEVHIVPLSRQAIALLLARRPPTPKAETLIFATSTGGNLANWDRATKALQADSGTTGWTRHDLRRTGATMLGDMGELPDIIEAALNHVSIHSQVATVYNRSRYRPQVAAALQRLADALDGIEQGAGQVVPMRPKMSGDR